MSPSTGASVPREQSASSQSSSTKVIKPSSNWTVKRLKFLGEVRSGVAKGKVLGDKDTVTLPYLRVANVQDGYLDLREVSEIEVAATEAQRYLLRKNDVLMNEGGDNDKLGRGAVWKGQIEPCIHQNHVFAVRLADPELAEWVSRFTSTDDARTYFFLRSKQSTNLASINQADVRELPVPIPPRAERIAISNYLEEQTARIDALIAEKEALLASLEQHQYSYASHLMTRGLDHSAALGPSGYAEVGNIPKHWAVKRLKFLGEVRSGIAKGKDHGERETVLLPYLRVANVQDGYVDLTEVLDIEVGVHEVDRYRLHVGDVLMNEGGDNDKLGRGTVWQGQIDPCVHQNHVFAVRLFDVTLATWVARFTSTDSARTYFFLRSKQSTNLASINQSNVRELPVPMPPEQERHAILAELQRAAQASEALTGHARRHIDRLLEYRSSLISAAVTGQLDLGAFKEVA